MHLINQRSAGIAISGRKRKKSAAGKSVITFSLKRAKNQVQYRKICQYRNPLREGTASAVHMAGIPHVSVTVSKRLYGK